MEIWKNFIIDFIEKKMLFISHRLRVELGLSLTFNNLGLRYR